MKSIQTVIDSTILSALFTLWCLLVLGAMTNSEGVFTYTLDDAYIHCAIAKNLAVNGTWGVQEGVFVGASSSPLWTLLLSMAMLCFGVHDVVPFYLNIIVGICCICMSYSLLHSVSRLVAWIGTLLVILCGSIAGLTATGMEHILHITLCLFFLIRINQSIVQSDVKSNVWTLVFDVVIAALCTAARYESIGLCLLCALWFFKQRQWQRGIALLLGMVFAIALYGSFSIYNGGWLLPNSVIVKSETIDAITFLNRLRNTVRSAFNQSPELLWLSATALLLLGWAQYKKSTRVTVFPKLLLLIAVMVTLLHIIAARVGASFRYEAYCIILLCVAIASFPIDKLIVSIRGRTDSLTERSIPAMLVLLITISAVMTIKRGIHIHHDISLASSNIRHQQFAMSSIVQSVIEPEEVCAVNDIGALANSTQSTFIDIVGLANNDVMRLRKRKGYCAEILDSMLAAQEVKVVALYELWWRSSERGGFIFPRVAGVQQIPKRWIYCGELRLQEENVVCGAKGVQFYATDSTTAARLYASVLRHGGTMQNTSQTSDP